MTDILIKMQEWIAQLNAKMDNMATNMVTKGEFNALFVSVKNLRNDVTGLKEDVRDIKEDVAVLKEDVSDIKQQLQMIWIELRDIKTRLDLLESFPAVRELRLHVQNLEARIAQLEAKQSSQP